jgi:hypothetical protein
MAITFGPSTAPNVITQYLDSVFSLSLPNYRKKLIDNIGASNAVLHEIMKGDSYESADGGTYIQEQLMYALAPMDSYDGYDELSTLPTDGITAAQFEWRQLASPIVYSMKEVIQNQHRLLDLVDARISQSELGIQEGWAQAFMWGAVPQGGALTSARTSVANGSTSIDPLAKLIAYNSSSLTVGAIPESANPWWRCQSATSAATTYSAYLYELENMYNTCALGTGGPPNLILMDQVSYQLWVHAYWAVFKTHPDAVGQEYPFVAKKFMGAKVVMDDKVPDAFSGTIGTQVGGRVTTAPTYGTAYFINTKFFKIRYHPSRDFELLKDENGKSFVKPLNGDSRVGHIGWMGNVTCNNRAKQGVLAKIARTLT